MKKVYLLISEDNDGHVHIDGVMTSRAAAEEAAKEVKEFWGRKVRVHELDTNNTLGFVVGYWHTKRDSEGKVTHTARLRVEPFNPA